MWNWLLRLLKSPRTTSEADADRDASDVLFTRPASWEDVIATARLLNRYEVRYLLVGGYALAAHGYVRMTEDIDIAVAPDPENSRRWVLALSELPDGAARALVNEIDPFEGAYLHAIRINDEITIDVMPAVAGVAFSELEQHSQGMLMDGVKIPVLGLQGPWKTKQGLRPKDQADAAVLRRAIEALRASTRDD
ncbi:nucleotidyltransferase domain-containing protein [Halochromatium sp.]